MVVSAPHLSAVLFFLLNHIDTPAVLPLYQSSFGPIGEAAASPLPPTSTSSLLPSSSTSFCPPLPPYRCFLSLFLGPHWYRRGEAVRLFGFYSGLFLQGAHRREQGVAITALRLGRFSIQLLPSQGDHVTSLYPLIADDPLPRDYSGWVDGLLSRLLPPDTPPSPEGESAKQGSRASHQRNALPPTPRDPLGEGRPSTSIPRGWKMRGSPLLSLYPCPLTRRWLWSNGLVG